MRAIYHINEIDKWKTTLNSCNNPLNVTKTRGETLELYIVASGDSVCICNTQDEQYLAERKRLIETADKGIHFMFCKKALEVRKVAWPDDFQKMQIIPSAALTLIEYQENGFPYIKQ